MHRICATHGNCTHIVLWHTSKEIGSYNSNGVLSVINYHLAALLKESYNPKVLSSPYSHTMLSQRSLKIFKLAMFVYLSCFFCNKLLQQCHRFWCLRKTRACTHEKAISAQQAHYTTTSITFIGRTKNAYELNNVTSMLTHTTNGFLL